MMLRWLVRLGMLGLAVWLIPKGAQEAGWPVYYRLTGTVVEGEIIGFLAGRHVRSVQPENTAMRNGHRIARPPVFRYPALPGGPASLQGRAPNAFTFSFVPYELGEKVTVVFPAGQPRHAQLFEAGALAGGVLFFGFGLLCGYIGLGGRL
jgi:hypothetical protein